MEEKKQLRKKEMQNETYQKELKFKLHRRLRCFMNKEGRKPL